jgi:hypothetical protein
MVLKIKSFIYRLSALFGKRIYLAQKEEEAYFAEAMFVSAVTRIITGEDKEDFGIGLHRGLWHVNNGFTTLYTRNMTRTEALKQGIIHLFRG